MTFERQFQLASHALAIVGVLALTMTNEVGAAYVTGALAALVWSAVRGFTGKGFVLVPGIANAATIAALGVHIVSLFGGEVSPVRAIAEFLLLLLAIKAFAEKENRDWLQIFVLSFFELVAASALTVEPAFALVFLVFLVLCPWVLVLFHLRREVGARGEGRRLVEEAFVEPSLLRGIATVTLVLFVGTLAVFVLFPRMGIGYFASALGSRTAMSGFTDELGLGSVSALRTDSSIAMRVTVDDPEPFLARPRYWRGAILEKFDGTRWTRGHQELKSVSASVRGVFRPSEAFGRGPLVRQEVLLEPMELPALFTVGRGLEVRGRFASLFTDSLGNLRAVWPSSTRIRYDVDATLDLGRQPAPASSSWLPPALSPRIGELARSLGVASSNQRARAEALLEFFRRGFEYSLEPANSGGGDALEHFLFESRSGHCEYFASALAVLLRASGIPSRVVNGYHGGEWNEYGRYFLIRQSDAHSWVEAYVDGEWTTLDATPPGNRRAPRIFGALAAMLDAAQMRWYRYVINYSGQDQVEMAFSIRDSTRRLGSVFSLQAWQDLKAEWRALASRRVESSTVGAWMLAGLTLAAAAWWLGRSSWRRRAAGDGASLSWASAAYASMLELLGRQGLVKRPGETPDEFCEKIRPAVADRAVPIARLTALYQEARFSGRTEAAAHRAEIERLLESLREPGP